MRKYLRVAWRHDFDDEPVTLLSEIVDGEEVRKVEIYRDGHADFADTARATGSTSLSETLMPSFEELTEQDEFLPEVIDAETLEPHGGRPRKDSDGGVRRPTANRCAWSGCSPRSLSGCPVDAAGAKGA